MRLLHVVPSYFPAVRYGGPIVSVHRLCEALVRRGHDVHVFTTNVDGPTDSDVPLGVPVDLDGVKVWYFPVPALRRLYWSPRMQDAMRREIGSFEVVHTHSVFLWPTWAAARAAKRSGVPYVVAPRGMLVQDLVRRKSRWAKLAWIRLVERANLEEAAAVHVTSNIEAQELARFGFRTPPVHVIPNGVNLREFESNIEPPSGKFAALAQTRYLLFIGRINWKKGLDRLIAALARLPEMLLVIAGNDEEGYQPTLQALADKHQVSNRIRFIGPAYGTDKLWLLRHAALLVAPSYSENFGNVVLEAMAAACPVVVTPEVGAVDIVLQSGAGLVLEGSPESLASGIAGLVSDAEGLKTMGRRGYDAVVRRYSWDSIAQDMEGVYGDVVSGQARMQRTMRLKP